MTDQPLFNGYRFEPQPDGSLEIHLSEEAGGTLFTTLPSDLVAALDTYFHRTTAAERQRGADNS